MVEPLTKDYAEKLAQELDVYDDLKDKIYDLARKVIKNSKLCIYAVRRSNMEEAEKRLKEMEEMRTEMFKIAKDNPRLSTINMIFNADQEYVEAAAIYYFMKEGRFPTKEELETTVQEYIAGIMDAAGELLRIATDKMIAGDVEFAKKVRNVIEEIYLFMLHVNPRDYELRRKIDYVTNILNKLQEFIFYKEVMGPVKRITGSEE
ncbi:haloacid dehalogenase [Ignicoccus pacificus DSM 13166]|uniref:Haloacid dehalogenase n=1 Tax=Ignicoccus pacificus DSM 13166 TaxID=940294 RepID=A0A977K9B8_9CREN|nr:haloacid dehalogenase [Ignicoccus pacificus DSM 13166]